MQVAASIVIIIVVVTIGFLVSGTVRRWRLERGHAAQREHRKKHKGAAAHKELVNANTAGNKNALRMGFSC